jgi:hypothetical protein
MPARRARSIPCTPLAAGSPCVRSHRGRAGGLGCNFDGFPLDPPLDRAGRRPGAAFTMDAAETNYVDYAGA